MKLDERLDRLIERAQADETPRVDVREAVIALLSSAPATSRAALERPLFWMAALSSTVAVSVIAAALFLYYSTADPLREVANSISWVLQ